MATDESTLARTTRLPVGRVVRCGNVRLSGLMSGWSASYRHGGAVVLEGGEDSTTARGGNVIFGKTENVILSIGVESRVDILWSGTAATQSS